MNIVVLNWRDCEHPEAGGAEIHFQEIFKRLVRNGHKVILITTRFKGSLAEAVQDGIVVYRWGHKYIFNWEVPLLIRRVMKKVHIDCIVDDVNKLPFFTSKWFPHIRCAAFFHHFFGSTIFKLTIFPFALYVLLLEMLCRWGYSKTPCCTVSASTALDMVRRGFPRPIVIENSVDTDKYCPQPSVVKEKDLLLYVGRLKKSKNIQIVMDALTLCNEAGYKLRFAIAGCGDAEDYLKKYAHQSRLDGQIIFLGKVSEDEKINLYRKAAIVVNPSLKEGWGITNIEASACATVVVANDVEGLRDSVRHAITGLLYKENDVKELARCIIELIRNDELRRQMEKAARQWALQFSWDRNAQRVEKWLCEIALADR